MNAVRWVALCLVSSGCTAAKAQFQIVSAEAGLHSADERDAARIAPFEHRMAALYLEKAKEKAGYSEYRVADALARKSTEWADRAIIYVEEQGKVEVRVEDFSEQAAPAQLPAPPLGPAESEPEPEELFGEGDEEEIEIDLGASPPAPAPAPAPAPDPDPDPAPAPAPKKGGPK